MMCESTEVDNRFVSSSMLTLMIACKHTDSMHNCTALTACKHCCSLLLLQDSKSADTPLHTAARLADTVAAARIINELLKNDARASDVDRSLQTAADILTTSASSSSAHMPHVIDILRRLEQAEHSNGTAVPVPVFSPVVTATATASTTVTASSTATDAAVPTVKPTTAAAKPQKRKKHRNASIDSSNSDMSKMNAPLEVGTTEPDRKSVV